MLILKRAEHLKKKSMKPGTPSGLDIIGLAVTMLQPCLLKVRFPDMQTAKKGFRLLYRSGHGVDSYGNFTYGLFSNEQLELLKTNNVAHEIVN